MGVCCTAWQRALHVSRTRMFIDHCLFSCVPIYTHSASARGVLVRLTMAPKSSTGTPLPGPSMEELMDRERRRLVSWRASLQAPASSSHMPTDAGRSYRPGRPHPMSMRSPLTLALPRPQITSARRMSSLWISPPSTCLTRPPPRGGNEPGSSSQAVSMITEAKAKRMGKRATPPVNYTARGDKLYGVCPVLTEISMYN